MSRTVRSGHVGVFWNLEDFKNLNYVKQPVTQEESDAWIEKGYDHVKSFTGMMYGNDNSMPEFVERFKTILPLNKQTYTFYKMSTLEIMPEHSDHYRTYMRLFDVPFNRVCRIVLMLEDWKPGHYLEVDKVGYVNWKAGDWFMWDSDTPHAASNIGIEDRYTLQITGESTFHAGHFDTHFFNVPGAPFNERSKEPLIQMRILPEITKDDPEKMSVVYFGNQKIEDLDQLRHTPEDRELIQSKGLHVYLYEPMCSYYVDQEPISDLIKHSEGFYTEFKDPVDTNKLRADELDSVREYSLNNHITNITVHSGEYDIEKWYPFYLDRMRLITDDLFLKSQSLIKNVDYDTSHGFTKKFICTNWRYTKHRHLVSIFMADKPCHLSWYFKGPLNTLLQHNSFDLNSWKHKHPDLFQKLVENNIILNKKGPYSVDIEPIDAVIIDHPIHRTQWPNAKTYEATETPAIHYVQDNPMNKFYQDAFVDIVNETRFGQPTSNFSEKVFHPVQYRKPFIMVAPPKTLEYIKTFGFKTFGDYWDESYDDEYDHGERLAKIFRNIEYINKLSMEELYKMYEDMKDILDHNFEVLNKTVKG